MRVILFSLMAISAIAAVAPTKAEARDYPFCMRTYNNSDDCSYPTYQACRAAASGLALTCFQNPALAYSGIIYDDEPPVRRSRRVRTY